MQAIQSTENASLDSNTPAAKGATLSHEISSTLTRQKNALLKHFEHGPIRTLMDQPPLAKAVVKTYVVLLETLLMCRLRAG